MTVCVLINEHAVESLEHHKSRTSNDQIMEPCQAAGMRAGQPVLELDGTVMSVLNQDVQF